MSDTIRRQWTNSHADLAVKIPPNGTTRLPITDPFEAEELHGGTSAEFVGAVITDLDDVAAFVATEP